MVAVAAVVAVVVAVARATVEPAQADGWDLKRLAAEKLG